MQKWEARPRVEESEGAQAPPSGVTVVWKVRGTKQNFCIGVLIKWGLRPPSPKNTPMAPPPVPTLMSMLVLFAAYYVNSVGLTCCYRSPLYVSYRNSLARENNQLPSVKSTVLPVTLLTWTSREFSQKATRRVQTGQLSSLRQGANKMTTRAQQRQQQSQRFPRLLYSVSPKINSIARPTFVPGSTSSQEFHRQFSK